MKRLKVGCTAGHRPLGPTGLCVFLLLAAMLAGAAGVAEGHPQAETPQSIEYTPLPGDDWPMSTPAERGLDPKLVTRFSDRNDYD